MNMNQLNKKLLSRKSNLTYDYDTIIYLMKKKRATIEEVLVEVKRAH